VSANLLDDRLALRAPTGAAVIDDGGRLAHADLFEHVGTLAGGLAAAGVGAGDAVTWPARPDRTSALLYRACWRLAAVAAPTHHRATDVERAELVRRLDPVVEVDPDRLPDGPAAPAAPSRAGTRAVVLFTSGSSGKPKGVCHTHASLAYVARLMADVHGLGPDDAVLMPAPLAHISGLLNGVLVPGVVPFTTVFQSRWDPDRALDLIEEHRVTFMIGPPTFFLGLLEAPSFKPERVASLRLVSSGGAGVTPAFVRRAGDELGCVVKRTYGSTEAPSVTTSRAGDDPDRCAESDGRVTGDAELRIVDPASGHERGLGVEGELWVRGPGLFSGYLDTASDEPTLTDGWFRTGDLARVDDGGWLTITGRLKDVIIRAGENIATAEVEAVLEDHPEVQQAVAVGEPDERVGERVAAIVVTSAPFDLEACRAWFEARGVARFKTPERVVVVDELPLLASGKPDRQAARRLL
jgi:cyclohexanecarboxylate-CoA ligase